MKTQNYHIPVLKETAVSFLNLKKGRLYVDATAGGGGHTEAILKSGGKVLAIDVDKDAIKHLKNKFKKEIETGSLRVIKGNFVNIYQIAKESNFLPVSGIIFDLGLSSHQIEDRKRGFSFESENLDMRADQDLKIDAKFIINNLDRRRLYELFKKYGQEGNAWSITGAIVGARRIAPITSAKNLVEVIRSTKPMKDTKINPATKVFQALRIAVNSELINLKSGLEEAVKLLDSGGRLVIIGYHSLEDGIIKDFFKKNDQLIIITKKPIRPGALEVFENRRARSAILRVAEKCQQ